MPLHTYECQDCGAVLEVLHPVGRVPERCGLNCQLKGEGPFGRGTVKQLRGAPNLNRLRGADNGSSGGTEGALPPELRREAIRQEALRRMGGEVTEAELDKLRDSGMTVYRKSGRQRWEKDGGDEAAPREIHGPDKDDS